MKNALFLICILPFISGAQVHSDKIQVLITNDFAKPLTVSYLNNKNEEVKTIVNAHATELFKISPEQFLHLKPRFFELDGKAYQVKFSLPSPDKYKIEVWDAIKKPNGITLRNKTHSLQILRTQTFSIHISKGGLFSLGVLEKKKLA